VNLRCTTLSVHPAMTACSTPTVLCAAQAVIALVQLYKVLTFRLDPERHPVPGELELRSGITLAPKVSCQSAVQQAAQPQKLLRGYLIDVKASIATRPRWHIPSPHACCNHAL